jgi:DNA polymerase I
MSSESVYLVDGSGYIFRAFYAVAPLTTKSGFPTNALFGFTRMLKKLLVDADSDHLAVAFDAGRETFRLEMYPEYKANRRECPSELIQQMPYFKEIVSALGIPLFELKGFEADDIIATLATKLAGAGKNVVIVSADKDLMQLIGPGVSMWDTLQDRHFGPAEVKEKFGVGPEKVAELLALTGDASDNVPGLEGVGPKTAAQLIELFGDTETVIASAEAIKNNPDIRNRKKIAERIELDKDKLRLSRRLVEVDRHSPIQVICNEKTLDVESLGAEELIGAIRRAPHQPMALRELINKFEFKTLFDDLDLRLPDETSEEESGLKYQTITAKNFSEWLVKLKLQTAFAFDTETTSLDTLEAELVGASFCWDNEEAYYLPLGHKNASDQIGLDVFVKECGAVLANPQIKKIGQNLKYDSKVLRRMGVDLKGISFDTMLAAYLLNPDRASYNLTVLAREFLNRSTIEFEEVVGELDNFSEVPVDKATRYACQDAHYAWLLKGVLEAKLSQAALQQVFSEIEIPLVGVLADMELRGVALDVEFLAKMSAEFGSDLERLQSRIYELAKGEFNINSPKQLSEVLFEKLAISTKGIKRTKTGISTDSSVLEKLAAVHPLPAAILEYRSLHKLKSTYIDALPAQISPVTGRLHTHFNQTVTATGRLSSSEPNLQNIPVQSKEGARIREAFVAPPGKLLISADYSQIELRLLAHMSADHNMSQAFLSDIDIHSQTARELLGLAADEPVGSDQRRLGKTINFGIIYGMGGFRLSRELGIPLDAANRYIEEYFDHYPGVRKFFDQLEQDAKVKGAVRTLYGRRRALSEIDTSGRDQGFALRAALNAPIQGSAADIIKKAMINLEGRIAAEKLPLSMILQIHDELLFEVDRDYCPDAAKVIRQEMEHVADLSVPLRVDLGSGRNWQEAKA